MQTEDLVRYYNFKQSLDQCISYPTSLSLVLAFYISVSLTLCLHPKYLKETVSASSNMICNTHIGTILSTGVKGKVLRFK